MFTTLVAGIDVQHPAPELCTWHYQCPGAGKHWLTSLTLVGSRPLIKFRGSLQNFDYSEVIDGVAGNSVCGVSCLGWLATMQLLATLSNSFWISGAQ